VLQYDKKYLLKRFLEKFLSGQIGDWLENILMKAQLHKIKSNTPVFNKDGVIAGPGVLKFHPEGVRDKYYKEWLKKVTKLDNIG
jgi:hypothetical protein